MRSKLFEDTLKHSTTLREMATRWRPTDAGGKWPMWIRIGSGVHGDGRVEHGVPHAHFESRDGEAGVFSLLDEKPPGTQDEVVVLEGKISSRWKKIIAEWAKARSEPYPEYTNWYVARNDWSVNRGV